VPHTWILECLEMYNINRTLRAFIKNSLRLWRTTLEASSKPVTQVTIKCGIYQGDALSPLLFCIGLNPLSQLSQRVATDTGSEVEQPSVTSFTWIRACERSGEREDFVLSEERLFFSKGGAEPYLSLQFRSGRSCPTQNASLHLRTPTLFFTVYFRKETEKRSSGTLENGP